MLKHWTEDDKFKKLSKQNKKNRLSDPEGLGPSLHTCGSIPISERKRRLVSNEFINECISYIQCVYIYTRMIMYICTFYFL